jgi:UDP-N-acetyl-D-galactosamine dehydrogenase
MTGFVADKLETLLADQNKNLANSRVLVMGVAFKPNVSDIRNSKAIVLARLLSDSGAQVETYDPHVDPATLERVGLKAVSDRAAMEAVYDALVVATGHTEFVETGADEYGKWLTTPGVIVDVPGSLCPGLDDTSGGCTHVYWRP